MGYTKRRSVSIKKGVKGEHSLVAVPIVPVAGRKAQHEHSRDQHRKSEDEEADDTIDGATACRQHSRLVQGALAFTRRHLL